MQPGILKVLADRHIMYAGNPSPIQPFLLFPFRHPQKDLIGAPVDPFDAFFTGTHRRVDKPEPERDAPDTKKRDGNCKYQRGSPIQPGGNNRDKNQDDPKEWDSPFQKCPAGGGLLIRIILFWHGCSLFPFIDLLSGPVIIFPSLTHGTGNCQGKKIF